MADVVSRLSKQLEMVASYLGLSFSFKDKPLSRSEVFAEIGLLPGLAKRADQLCALCLGYGIGAHFEDAEGTMLGQKVTFDEVTPDVLRYLCFLDVLLEFQKTSPSGTVVLDDLVYE
jgi:intracellular multiplication protein IcmS